MGSVRAQTHGVMAGITLVTPSPSLPTLGSGRTVVFISFSVFLSRFPTFHLIWSFLWGGDAMPTGRMNTLRLSKVM